MSVVDTRRNAILMSVGKAIRSRVTTLSAIRRALVAAGHRPPGVGRLVVERGIAAAEAEFAELARRAGIVPGAPAPPAPKAKHGRMAKPGSLPDATRERSSATDADDDWGN